MSKTVIKVENLSKQYRLGQVGTGTISHDLNRWWARVRGKEDPYLKIGETNDRSSKATSEYVWALQDINFEVKQGEVLGIIGKNGAGKSTLLKILSKVTGPTTGAIKAKGRIASLLEVGTGFHPELTGRENIFLNGTILGMTKAEVKAKLEEIVDFAGVERYLDTPVKRYSSGMMVRLGFAVAAHLEPEILIVDEVLAVGDAEFQKKAIGKMQEVSSEGGRTVLFVSHNMSSVNTLCTQCILLKDGHIKMKGPSMQVVNQYLSLGKTMHHLHHFEEDGILKGENLIIESIGLRPKTKGFDAPISTEDNLEIIIVIESKKEHLTKIDTTLQFKDHVGNYIFPSSSMNSFDTNYSNKISKGKCEYICEIPGPFFNEGEFSINLLIVENQKRILKRFDTVLSFTVTPSKRLLGTWMGKSVGVLKPKLKWRYVTIEDLN